MKKQLLRIAALGITVCMVLIFSLEAYAADGRMIYGKQKPAGTSGRHNSFCISTVYSGGIDDQITYAGREFRITKETAIYVVGEGLKEDGIRVQRANIFLSGINKNGIPTARMILIRKEESIFEQYQIETKSPAKAIPSEENPNVGELAEDAPM